MLRMRAKTTLLVGLLISLTQAVPALNLQRSNRTSSNSAGTSIPSKTTSESQSESSANITRAPSGPAHYPTQDAFVGPLECDLWMDLLGEGFYCPVGGGDDCRTKCKGTMTTLDGPRVTDLNDQCVLWDPECQGDKGKAKELFFNSTVQDLKRKKCFLNQTDDCGEWVAPDILEQFTDLKNWMRTEECDAGYSDFKDADYPCCEHCQLRVQNVDLFYWPDPDADTSCLSIVGNKDVPLDYGITPGVNGDVGYWGCTLDPPSMSYLTNTRPPYATYGSELISTLTTAALRTLNGVVFKQSEFNPWDPPKCKTKSWETPPQSAPARADSKRPSLTALHIPHNITKSAGPAPSTMVSNGFTYTSPSIYAKFYNIEEFDLCGNRGSVDTIKETMLSFTPGELSTIRGPFIDPEAKYETAVFDFKDLPCPPQSVMEGHWYKPEPGVPYAPIIALPQKVRDIDPWYNCTDLYFRGYPGRAMAPTAVAANGQNAEVTPAGAHVPEVEPPQPGQKEVPAEPKKTAGAMVDPSVSDSTKKAEPEKAEPEEAEEAKAEPEKAEEAKAEPEKSEPKEAEAEQVGPEQVEPEKAEPNVTTHEAESPKADVHEKPNSSPNADAKGDTQKAAVKDNPKSKAKAKKPDETSKKLPLPAKLIEADPEEESKDDQSANPPARDQPTKPVIPKPAESDKGDDMVLDIEDPHAVPDDKMSALRAALSPAGSPEQKQSAPKQAGLVPIRPSQKTAPKSPTSKSRPNTKVVDAGKVNENAVQRTVPESGTGDSSDTPMNSDDQSSKQRPSAPEIVSDAGDEAKAVDTNSNQPAAEAPSKSEGAVSNSTGPDSIAPDTEAKGDTIGSYVISPFTGTAENQGAVAPDDEGEKADPDTKEQEEAAAQAPQAITILSNGITAARLPNGVVSVGGAIISAGAPAATIQGQKVSVGKSADSIEIGGQVEALPPLATHHKPAKAVNTVELSDGVTVLQHPDAIAIAGTTLSAGAAVATIPNLGVVSYDYSANAVAIGSSTEKLPSAPVPAATASPQPPGDVTAILADSVTVVVGTVGLSIYGTTLVAGAPVATVLGTRVSFDAAKNEVVMGTRTETLPSTEGSVGAGTTTSAAGPSPSGGASGNSTENAVFEGAARRIRCCTHTFVAMACAIVAALL